MRVNNHGLPLAETANVLFTVENELHQTAIRLDMPLSRFGNAADLQHASQQWQELASRQFLLQQLSLRRGQLLDIIDPGQFSSPLLTREIPY